jgi:hypothetical protein
VRSGRWRRGVGSQKSATTASDGSLQRTSKAWGWGVAVAVAESAKRVHGLCKSKSMCKNRPHSANRQEKRQCSGSALAAAMYMYSTAYKRNQEPTAHVPGERSPRCGHKSCTNMQCSLLRPTMLAAGPSLNALL